MRRLWWERLEQDAGRALTACQVVGVQPDVLPPLLDGGGDRAGRVRPSSRRASAAPAGPPAEGVSAVGNAISLRYRPGGEAATRQRSCALVLGGSDGR